MSGAIYRNVTKLMNTGKFYLDNACVFNSVICSVVVVIVLYSDGNIIACLSWHHVDTMLT